ncbi:MAG: phytanoyl-CoA dioxygenase family protein [Alphaproteobacteria bacterium]|nr:phytanoyl-CoA dioxygenase family protein [Alphaproteobacteria bacterium]
MTDFPDFSADRIDPTKFMRAINSQGCCLVRGALPPEGLAPYLELARAAYAFREHQDAQGDLPEAFVRNFYEVGHTLPQDLEGAGGIAGMIDMVLKSPLRRLLKGIFGAEVSFILNNTLPRKVDATGKIPKTPFHQDATFLQTPSLILNLWTPLQDCGVTAPGLEVLAKPLTNVETPPNYAQEELFYYDRMGLAEDAVIGKFGAEALWHPEMKVGDVLIFTHLTIHRTHLTPEMTEDRISMEMRCGAANAPALQQRGFDLHTIAV